MSGAGLHWPVRANSAPPLPARCTVVAHCEREIDHAGSIHKIWRPTDVTNQGFCSKVWIGKHLFACHWKAGRKDPKILVPLGPAEQKEDQEGCWAEVVFIKCLTQGPSALQSSFPLRSVVLTLNTGIL